MFLNYAALRRYARESLRGTWGSAAGVTLLFLILVGPLSYIPFWGIFMSGTITIGYTLFILKKVRGQHAELGDLFSQFKSGLYLKSVGASLLTAIYTFLWTLLFVIPGIIKSYSYSMTYFILLDHPEYTVNEAITKSREIMDGHKAKLFVLQLTFLGWFLLCSIVPFGFIGFFWLIPYYNAAKAHFYLKITGQAREESPVHTNIPSAG
ncbi:DUF975 family protein [Thermoactinomyces sp. CICC 10521]|jgi:uncharacterized membrane protein|nr:DUF975 family protein [Thermoactinomyces sp. CICC 10523]MBH8604913.1 DUF975 family protein [Thermoactinomyces sp. CICC 10522]MBH8608371.1 DUF975 family protein [Thermoactinomyces sp. CICC 10521]